MQFYLINCAAKHYFPHHSQHLRLFSHIASPLFSPSLHASLFPIICPSGLSVGGLFFQPWLLCQRGRFGPWSRWILPSALLQTQWCGAPWQRRDCSAGRSDGDSETSLMSLQRGQSGHVGRAEQTNLSSSLTQQEVGIDTCTPTHWP